MLSELLEELKHNKEINIQQGLENRVDIDYIIERIESINVWYEVARNEVETAIDDIYNDEYYCDEEKSKLDKITDKDINRIAWKVYDNEYVWQDVYETAREEVVEELELE